MQVFVDDEAVKHAVGTELGVKEWVVVSQGRTARQSERIARRAPAFRPKAPSARLTHGRPLSICVTSLLFEIVVCGCRDSSHVKP